MVKVEKFNVRIVNKGEKYGLNDCLTNNKAPMIEFYDSRYQGCEGRGQFVSRYYTSTILDGEYANGLSLDGGIPAWSVSADGMKQVVEFLHQQ